MGQQGMDSAVHSFADVVDDSVDHVKASGRRVCSGGRGSRNPVISSESIGADDSVNVYEKERLGRHSVGFRGLNLG
jgi:hypothetical protein